MGDCANPTLGVIEGFFGRDWGWEGRRANLSVLAAEGYDLYVYAPKSDRVLRQDWREPFEAEHLSQLARLRAQCAEAGLRFGIGLTPYGLDAANWKAEQQALDEKLHQIKALELDWLCLLFDDTPGGEMGMAELHIRAATTVLNAQVANHLALCPAYYSDDPILDQVFGARPEGYLEALGQGVPHGVDLFWTGPKVVSPDLDVAHLQQVTEILCRKPLIWDNGAVNDSRALSAYLPLDPAIDRSPPLADHVTGLLVNPINQPGLARLPLAILGRQWRGRDGAFELVARNHAGADLAQLLAQDLDVFSSVGFGKLTPENRALLKERYSEFSSNVLARDILDWLAGGYVFDPACLT